MLMTQRMTIHTHYRTCDENQSSQRCVRHCWVWSQITTKVRKQHSADEQPILQLFSSFNDLLTILGTVSFLLKTTSTELYARYISCVPRGLINALYYCMPSDKPRRKLLQIFNRDNAKSTKGVWYGYQNHVRTFYHSWINCVINANFLGTALTFHWFAEWCISHQPEKTNSMKISRAKTYDEKRRAASWVCVEELLYAQRPMLVAAVKY